ncbi:MAG: hypothetical protein WD897_00920 [Parcubacteria group bacterium]
MPKNKVILTLGIIIALQPFMGFPHAWEAVFQVMAGLLIVLLSVWVSIDKRLSLRVKAQRRQLHKRREVRVEADKATEPIIQEEVL